MMIPGLDPMIIGTELARLREASLTFDVAWRYAAGPEPTTEVAMYRFMKKQFRAAYVNDSSRAGRCTIPDRDVSWALLFAPSRDHPPTRHERCRSGDGCDRVATCGRHGVRWCEYHGAELARLAVKLAPRAYQPFAII